MGLNIEEIKTAIRERKNRETINKAIRHQDRIKFHAEVIVKPDHSSRYSCDFLEAVQALIPHDKYEVFKALFQFPVKTNEVTGVIFDKLSKVFEGRNPAYNYQFNNPENRDDWEYYRQDILNEPNVWQSKGWRYFKTEINSVLIVDLPEKQTDRLPQPYFYWLTIDNVIDYRANENGTMQYIIFNQDNETIAVIDDECYRLFENKNNDIGALKLENKHDLGYCPARFFWNEELNIKEPDVKASPLSKELESLDKFLFYYISKKHLDLYGSYPIYSGYEKSSCDFENANTGEHCKDGYLQDGKGHFVVLQNGKLMPCPKCGEKKLFGAGSFIEVPTPIEGQPDLSNPVRITTIDRASLDYNVTEYERLRQEIITAVVGVDNEIINDQAVNQLQVEANYESKSAVINRIKKGFEEAQQFVDSTCCRLRYGSDFVSASINHGTEFFTLTAAALTEQYKKAKEAGLSEAELENLRTQITETETRNNPLQMQRMVILNELEPMNNLARTEAMNLYEKGLISQEELMIKLNFPALVRRFEREQINIIEFASERDFKQKIELITSKFKEYVRNEQSIASKGQL